MQITLTDLGPPKTKICSMCGKSLPKESFYIRPSAPDGLRDDCKDCSKAMAKKWSKENYSKNRESILIKERLKKKSPRGRYTRCKEAARRRNISFQLSFEEFMTFWQKPCAYCGGPIDHLRLDRIDSKIGYCFENCVSCCYPCNWMKRNMSYDEWIKHMKKIIAHIGDGNAN